VLAKAASTTFFAASLPPFVLTNTKDEDWLNTLCLRNQRNSTWSSRARRVFFWISLLAYYNGLKNNLTGIVDAEEARGWFLTSKKIFQNDQVQKK
jgi:hypothetical protein